MTAGLLVLTALAVGALAWALLRARRLPKQRTPGVRVEYWVYTKAGDRPTDEALLQRIGAQNPHRRGLPVPVGEAEEDTIRDDRFSVNVFKRQDNAVLFRADLWAEEDTELPPPAPALVKDAQTILAVRFLSEEPPEGRAYLQFVTHAADAVAELSQASLVLDTEAQLVYMGRELYDALEQHSDGTRSELHVAVRWSETPAEGRAFTRGMAKAGLPDLEMPHQPLDQRTLALFLVEEAARECWKRGAMETFETEAFGEVFVIEFSESRIGLPTHRGWISTLSAGRKLPV